MTVDDRQGGGAWGRIREVFERTLELPVELRASFLVEACGSDTALREQVEA